MRRELIITNEFKFAFPKSPMRFSMTENGHNQIRGRFLRLAF